MFQLLSARGAVTKKKVVKIIKHQRNEHTSTLRDRSMTNETKLVFWRTLLSVSPPTGPTATSTTQKKREFTYVKSDTLAQAALLPEPRQLRVWRAYIQLLLAQAFLVHRKFFRGNAHTPANRAHHTPPSDQSVMCTHTHQPHQTGKLGEKVRARFSLHRPSLLHLSSATVLLFHLHSPLLSRCATYTFNCWRIGVRAHFTAQRQCDTMKKRSIRKLPSGLNSGGNCIGIFKQTALEFELIFIWKNLTKSIWTKNHLWFSNNFSLR